MYRDAATSRAAGKITGENMEECSTHISSLFFLFQLIFIECLDCVRSCPKHHAYKQEEVTVCLKAESGRSRQVNRLSAHSVKHGGKQRGLRDNGIGGP